MRKKQKPLELDDLVLEQQLKKTDSAQYDYLKRQAYREIIYKINQLGSKEAKEFRKTVEYHNLAMEYLGEGYGNEKVFRE